MKFISALSLALATVGCRAHAPDAPVAATAAPARWSVVTSYYDNLRTGANTHETVLDTRNVNPAGFGLLFSRQYEGNAYAQPLFVPDLEVAGARRNVVFVATTTNNVYAFDADDPAASAPLWSRRLGPPGDVRVGGENPNTVTGQAWCRDMFPFVGVTSTPVIDRETGRMYVVSKEGKLGQPYVNKLHALDIATGSDAAGSPVVIEAAVEGTAKDARAGKVVLDPWKHLNRAGLLLHERTLYLAMASHCDDKPYHGWILSYDPTTLRQKAVFNTTPHGEMGGIWQAGVGLSANVNGVFSAVGNGTWSADGKALGLSVVRLKADLTLADWFTPSNADRLNAQDNDLTSGAVLAPGTNLVFAGGKEGILYAIDQRAMSHFNAAGDKILQRIAVADPGRPTAHIHTIAVWDSRVYVWPENSGLQGYAINGQGVAPTPAVRSDGPRGVHPGGIFTISSNGTAPGTGIVWATLATAGDAWHDVAVGNLVAVDATSGARLWDSDQAARDKLGNLAKFTPPIVANGKVYVATFTPLNATSPAFLRVYGLHPRSAQ
jgi:outer membrane protein assembly factor BamB